VSEDDGSSNYVRLPFDAEPRQQAWGVAAREGQLLKWCFEQGPSTSWRTYTERAAKLEAFQSNNQQMEGFFVAVPIPNHEARYDISKHFDPGPIGDERTALAVKYRSELLAGQVL
jgi:hypothetical protein